MLAVILPTFNDPHRLRLCLKGLALQTLPADQFVVCITSDGGDQEADKAVCREAFGWGLTTRYAWLGGKKEGEFRAAACRNLWLRKLLPETFPRTLFLDSDCVPASGVLKAHDDYGANPQVVVGAREHIPEDRVAQLGPEHVPYLYQLVHKKDDRFRLRGKTYGPIAAQLGRGVRVLILPSHRLVWSFQLSVPTALAQRLGGFNEEFVRYGGEDQEFGARLQQAGAPLLGRFDLICYHLDHPKRQGNWKRQVEESIRRSDPVRNGGPLHGTPEDHRRDAGRSAGSVGSEGV